MVIRGRVWKFGDDINTDLIMPGHAMFLPPAKRPPHCMSANRPDWAAQVTPGDVLVAGRNFGTGSGRPGARVLKDLGISCLLADSINGLFFRNCVNDSLPALELEGVSALFEEGQIAEIQFASAEITNVDTGGTLQARAWPASLLAILNAGGILNVLEAEGLISSRDS